MRMEIYTSLKDLRIYGVRGTILEYHELLTKIPNLWKTVINNNKPYCILNAYNTSCNVYVGTLLQDEKGCRRFYDIMIQATDTTIQNKWERDFRNISQHELQKYNSMIKDLNEVALNDFQFKIINKILATKSFLQRIGKLAEN